MTSAKTVADSGAISLGFSTIVQPAASAGATLQAIWFIGQFQGVMKPADADRLADEAQAVPVLGEGKVSSTLRIVVR